MSFHLGYDALKHHLAPGTDRTMSHKKDRKGGKPPGETPPSQTPVPQRDARADAGFFDLGNLTGQRPLERRKQISPLHTFWGQIGIALVVCAIPILFSGSLSSPLGIGALRGAFIAGLYLMFAPFAGLPLPEPRPQTQGAWRLIFCVAAIAVIGGFFFQPMAQFFARLRSAPPEPLMPLATRWPPVIEYGTIGDGKDRVIVDFGLVNTTNAEVGVTVYYEAVVRPAAKNDDEQAQLQNLSDDVHRQQAGIGTTTIRVPKLDSSKHFVIAGPEVSPARWSDIQAGRAHVYFYALMHVEIGKATYPSIACGVGAGSQIHVCPPALTKQP